MNTYRIHVGDARELPLNDGSVHCCVTSPPYWGLRDYGVDGQIGLERTPQEYVDALVAVFREVRRVLRDDGTVWLNLGDSYNAYNGNRGKSKSFQKATEDALPDLPTGHGLTCKTLKPKDIVGIPWRVAFALQADGWYLRSDIIWSKPNPMPESVTDRPTKAHEYVFLLSKSPIYYFGQDDVREPHKPELLARYEYGLEVSAPADGFAGAANPRAIGHCKKMADNINMAGRNIRTVWNIATEPCKEAHFAVMPRALARRCILAGCPIDGTVLDPFGGAGTVALEAVSLNRNAVICELNPKYAAIARRRLQGEVPLLAQEVA